MKILGASKSEPGAGFRLFPVTHSKYLRSSVRCLLLSLFLALFSLTIITNASQNHTLAHPRQTTVRNQSGKQLNSTLGKQLHLQKGNQSKKPYTPATSSSYSKHGYSKYPDISQLERMVALASGSSMTNTSAPRITGQEIPAELQASLNSLRKQQQQQQQQQPTVSNSSRLDQLEREVLPSSPFSSAIEPVDLLASVRHEERPLGRTELIEQVTDDYAQPVGYDAAEHAHIPLHHSNGITRLNHHRYVPQEASYLEHVKQHHQYAHQPTYDGHDLPSIAHHSLAGVARAPAHRYIPQEVLRHNNQYSHPTGVNRVEGADDSALDLAELRLANQRAAHEGAYQSGEHPSGRGDLASGSSLYPSHLNAAAEKRAAHIRVVFNNNPQFIIGRGAADGHVLGGELRKKHSGSSYGSNHDDYHSDESSLDETKVIANAPSKASASETSEESALPCNKDKLEFLGKSKLIPNMEHISLSPSSELSASSGAAAAAAEVDSLAKKPANNSHNFEKVDDENGPVNVPFNEIIKSGIRPPLRMVISMRNKNGDVMKLPINLHGSSKARAPSLDLGSQMRIHFEPQTDPIPELEPPEQQQQQQQHIDENTPIGGDIFDPSISRPFSTKSRVSARAREEPRPVPIITPQQFKDKPDQVSATNSPSVSPVRLTQTSTSFVENSPESPARPTRVEPLPSAPPPPAIAPKLTDSSARAPTTAHTEALPVPQAQVRLDPASLPASGQVSQQLPGSVSAKIKVESNEDKAKALNQPFVPGETPIPTLPTAAPTLSSVHVKVEQPASTQGKETNAIANVDQQEKRQRDCDRDDDDNNNNPQIIIPSIGLFQNRTLASIFEQFQRAFSEQMQQPLSQQQQQPQQIPTLQLQDQLPQIHQIEQQFLPQQQFSEQQQQQQQQQMFQQTRPELQRAASADNRNEANSNINNNNEEHHRRRQQQALDQQEDLMVAMMASNMSSPETMTGGVPKQVSMTVIHPPKGTSIEDAIRVHATNAQNPSQTVAILHSARDNSSPSVPQIVEQGELSVVEGNDNEARPFSVNVQLRPPGNPNPNPQPNQDSSDQAQTDPDGFASGSRYSPRYIIGRSAQSTNTKLHPRFKRSAVIDGEYAERQLEPADRLSNLRPKSRSNSFPTLVKLGTRLTDTNSTFPINDKEDIIMSAASDEHQNEVDGEGDSDSNGDEEPSESDMDSRSDSADLDDSPDGSDLDDSPDESAGFGDSDDEPYNQGASSERDYNSPASFEIPQIEINPNTLQQRGCKTVLREVQELPLNGLGASSASGASQTVSPNSPSARRTKRSPNSNQNLINSRKVTSIVMTKECHFPNDSTGSPSASTSSGTQPQTSNVVDRAAQLIMNNNVVGLKGPALSENMPIAAQRLQKQPQQQRAPIQRRSLTDSPVQNQVSGTAGRDRDFYVVSDSRRNEVIAQKLYKPPSEDDPYHTLSYSSKNGADPEDSELDRQLVYNPDAPIPGEKRTQLEASPGRQLSPSERRALLDPNHDDTDPVRPEPTEAPEPAEEQDDGEPDDEDEKPKGVVMRSSGAKRPTSGIKRADSPQKGRQQLLQGKRQQQAAPERRFGKSFRLEHKLSRPADSQSGLGAQLRKLPVGKQGFVERRTGGSSKRRPANNQRDDQQAVLAAIEREDRDTADDELDDDDDDEPAASSADSRMGGRGTGSGVNSRVGGKQNAQAAPAPELDEPDADPDYNPREGRIPAHSKPKKIEKSFAYVHRDVPKKGTKNPDDFVVSYGRGNVQTEHEDYDSDRDPRVQSEDPSEDKPAAASAQRPSRLVTPTAAPHWQALSSTTPSNLFYQPAQAPAQAHYMFPASGREMELLHAQARNLGQQDGPAQSNANLPILMRFG